MDLSIIIVSYNTKELLRRCLESIIESHKATKPQSHKVEIVVVDNGSDYNIKYQISNIKKRYKKSKVRLIQNKENLGFAKANNQGIRKAKGKYVLLLNSDTKVKSGALSGLVEFARKHPEAGAIGPQLINTDGSVQPSVYHFPTIWRAIKEYWLGQKEAYEKYAPAGNKPVEAGAVVGAAMLIPKKVFSQIGFLDERYFMYFEDLDFCRRVKRAGLKIFYLPAVEIIHHHGASGKEIPQETRSWLVQSSKIYHGFFKHYLINFIIWSSQKWQRL